MSSGMLDGLKIVRARKEHIDDIAVVENLSFRIPWSRQSLTAEFMHNDNAVYFCALIDGKAVGYAGMWQVCDEGHITNIAVHPEFRCIGIGSALVEALLKEAESRGLTALTLEVRKSNSRARSIYMKYGFEDGGMRKAYYSDNNEDAIIMWKRLKV
ncbi:MAG: ribosomal protein S18-alanine N-acetyltransferase [Acetivibrionales bacterium]|jgi:ribosomal-protein-alanine N-acetyltransferase|nr:ribosomal protein S18-alanine N-acetyltransferase [Clostridiales bacterium]